MVLATLCIVAYSGSDIHRFIEGRASNKLFFSVRNAVESRQTLNPRLKIFSFDDSSFAALKAPVLSLKTWVEVLEGLDRRAPEAIYIDQIFSLMPESGADREQLLRRLRTLKTPIISAAFVTPAKISGRTPLELNRPEFQLRTLFVDDHSMLINPFPPFADRIGWFAYGPGPGINEAIRTQGHVMNQEGGYVSSMLKLSPQEVIPHLSLTGPDTVKISNSRIFWKNHEIPINNRGEILANFLNPYIYYKGSRRMLGLINSAAAGAELNEINAADTVLLLPSMFTGSVDMADTPVGKLPGGFVIASMINSRMNKNWFSYQQPMEGIVWLALLAVFPALFLPTILVFPILAFALALVVCVCLGSFVWFSLVISLSGAVVAVFVYSTVVIFQRFDLFQRLNLLAQFLRDENNLMQSELRQANEISRVFVPVATPEWSGLEIGTFHQPMTMGSGDWYTFEKSRSGNFLHYIMCDISGHGVQAAIIVSTCKTVMSMLVLQQPESLESVEFAKTYIDILNKTLLSQGMGQHTATLATASFVRDEPTVHVAVCGHPRPILFRGNKADLPRFVGLPTNILGVSDSLEVRMEELQMADLDSLIIYTDGVEFPRALNKVVPFYRRYCHVDANTAAKFLVADVMERKKSFGSIEPDDVSLVWFRKVKKTVRNQAS